MTEEEARSKICSKYRAAVNGNLTELVSRFSSAELDNLVLCDGSACMMWPECLSWWIEHEKGNEPIKVEIVGGKA